MVPEERDLAILTTASQRIPSAPPEKGIEWEGESPLEWETNF
jgi:hypothetical protein